MKSRAEEQYRISNARDNSPHVNTSYVSTLVVGLALLVGLALPHVTRPLVVVYNPKFTESEATKL